MKNLIATLLLSASITGISLPVLNMSENIIAASADSTTNPDLSDPLSDLLVVDDFRTAYTLGQYAIDSSADSFDILYILEWKNGFITNNYSLYLYVFNKSGKGSEYYNFEYSQNKIEIYSELQKDYVHVPITFVTKTANNAFLKFKIEVDNIEEYSKPEKSSRSYAIIGMEIAHKVDLVNVLKDYPIGKLWNFYDSNGDLSVSVSDDVQVLQLDLHGGVYTVPNSQFSWDNLYYAYFGVPKTFDGQEYNLYSVHADYYKFDFGNKIGFIEEKKGSGDEAADTFTLEYYQELYNTIMTTNDNAERQSIISYLWSEIRPFSYIPQTSGHFLGHAFFDPIPANDKWPGGFKIAGTSSQDRTNAGFMVLYQDIHNLPTDFWDLSNIYRYNYYDGSFYPIPIENLSTGTSTSNQQIDVDGYSVSKYFDVDRAEEFTGQDRNSAYQNISYTNDKNPLNDAEYKTWTFNHIPNINCIQKIDIKDVAGNEELNNSLFSSKYLLNSKKITEFKEICLTNELENLNTYLFRFDTAKSSVNNIYENIVTYGWQNDYRWNSIGFNNHFYRAIATKMNNYVGMVDFDVIDLTFVNESQELLKIPVVADPINIFPDVHINLGNSRGCSKLGKTILLILGIVLLIFIIIRIIPIITGIQTKNATKKANKNAIKARKTEHKDNENLSKQIETLNKNLENSQRENKYRRRY